MFDVLRFAAGLTRLAAVARKSRAEIEALQQERWRQMLRHARDHSPYYSRVLRGLDLDRCRPADVPPLRKAELMAHFDEIVTDPRLRRDGVERFLADPDNLGKPYLGRYAVCHTSGSQGQPALVVQHRRDMLVGSQAQMVRGQALPPLPTPLLFVGRVFRPARVAVVTQKPGFYPSGAAFAYLAAAAPPILKILRLSVFAPSEETIGQLNAFRPDYLTGYTSGLERLARAQRDGRLRLRLKGVTNVSEPLPPPSRAAIEQAFGARVSDCYAMGECLGLTSGCPHYPGAHLNADLARLEVVDDAYRPVPDGEPGTRVLVTNLYNRVQPFIRYEVEDVVTLSRSPCPCGSPLPLVASVGGRTRERFWVEVNGRPREIPYYLFLAALHHCTRLAEHQVVQTGRNRFVIRVAPLPGETVSADEVRGLVRQSVRAEGLADVVEAEVEVVPEIERDPLSGKMRRARNLVGGPADEAARGQACAASPV